MIGIIAILAIVFANYMFLRRDKQNMHREERSNEKRERLMEILCNRADKNKNPE